MQIEEYIVDIIRTEMELSQNNVWIRAQNRKIPPETEELYCVVGCVDFLPISSKSRFENEKEVQTVYGRASVQIDLMSRNNLARTRRAELLMALNSYYSKGVQDKYQFRIFELPQNFVNTSGREGGSDINRFTLVIRAMISEDKTKDTAYYDTFAASIWSQETDTDVLDLQIDE